MCAKLKKAMPVSSSWTAHFHPTNKDLGLRVIKAHRSRDFILSVGERTGYLGPPLPKADHVILEDDGRVVILDECHHQPLLTYTPA